MASDATAEQSRHSGADGTTGHSVEDRAFRVAGRTDRFAATRVHRGYFIVRQCRISLVWSAARCGSTLIQRVPLPIVGRFGSSLMQSGTILRACSE